MSPTALAKITTKGLYRRPPHIAATERCLLELSGRAIEFLLVSFPPRHGKSELISKYFPAWYIGQFPDQRVILTSYEATIARSWGRKVRDLLLGYGHLFDVKIRPDVMAQEEWETTAGGGMITAGVGGPITGKGGNLLIIDDPIKNAEEARSATVRENIWEWWQSTFFTRRQPGSVVIVVQTRWHENDLTGRLLEESGLPWHHLKLPALAEANDPLGREPGAPLWPAQYPLAELERIRGTAGAHWWAALYQQSPVPIGDTMFRPEWPGRYIERNGIYYLWRRNETMPRMFSKTQCIHFGMMDLAASTKEQADYTVLASWAMTPERDLILLDVDRRRLEGPDQIPMMLKAREKWGLRFIGVESVAYQLSLLQYARRANIMVKAVKADRDKVSRALSGSAAMENGKFFFPDWAPWKAEYEKELFSFPTGAHDDQVDVTSYAAIYAGHRALQGTA